MKKLLELLFLQQLKGIGKTSINKKYLDVLQTIDGMNDCADIVNKVHPGYDENDIRQAMISAEHKYKNLANCSDIHVITVFDEDYPKKLYDLKNKKPVILYAKGQLKILNDQGISVIGTRAPSPLTYEFGPVFVNEIVKSRYVVVSGLALGCDTIAHENTLLKKGMTVAVLPSGINNIYPETNKKLADEIVSSGGCLISEYEPDVKAAQYTFAERDSVIATLSKATVVLECGIKSGTMITVDAAEKLNRKIACYYSKRKIKEGFEGNSYILSNKISYKIVNKKDFLLMVKAEPDINSPEQISLL